MSTPEDPVRSKSPADELDPRLNRMLDEFQKGIENDTEFIKRLNDRLIESHSKDPSQPAPKLFKDDEETRMDYAARIRNNFQRAIESSPELKADLLREIEAGRITKFGLTSANESDAGSYSFDEKTLRIHPITALAAQRKGEPNYIGDAPYYKLVGTIGHETDHSQNAEKDQAARTRFEDGMRRILGDRGPVHDYTQVAEDRLLSRRTTESRAQVDFYNAIALTLPASERTFDNIAARMSARERGDFFEDAQPGSNQKFQLRNGLTLDPSGNMLLPQTDANVKTLESTFFDREQFKVAGVDTRYRDRVGAQIIGTIIANERANGSKAEIQIDLNKLGLDRERLAPYLQNLHPPAVFYDISNGGKVRVETGKPELSPTIETPKPNVGTERTPAPQPGPLSIGSSRDHNDTNAAVDRTHDTSKPALLTQAETQLMPLWARLGTRDPNERDNLTAAVAESAARGGMKRIDQIAISTDGKNVIPIEGRDPYAPWANRTAVDIQQGQQQPAEQSLAALDRHQQQRQDALAAQISAPQQESGLSRGARTL